jgi:hypothetical protein
MKATLTTVGVCLSLSVAQASAGFEVAGACTRDDFSSSGRLLNSAHYEFKIVVDGCRFDLTLKEAGSEEDYREVASDGASTFYVSVFRTAVERARAKEGQVGENIASATVLKRSVPNLGSYSPAGEIWLAYASGWYFAKYELGKQGQVRTGEIDLASGYGTAAGSDVEELREKRPARWILAENAGAPKWVAFFEGGFARSHVAPDGSFRRVSLPAVYANGFTNSLFVVLEETNSPAGAYATRSRLTSYWVKPDGVSSNDLWAKHVYTIVATNCSTGRTGVVTPPALPGPTLIVEGRFVDDVRQPKSSFSYMGTSFPSEERVRSSPGYRNAKEQPRLAERHSGKSRPRLLFFMLAATTTVALLVILRVSRRQEVAR